MTEQANKKELKDTSTKRTNFDSLILTIAVGILALAIAGFYYYAETTALLYRVLGLLVAVGVTIVMTLQTQAGMNFWKFTQDSRTEVRKVVWPTRSETIQTTLTVLVMVVIVAIFLWLLDMFLAWAVRALIG